MSVRANVELLSAEHIVWADEDECVGCVRCVKSASRTEMELKAGWRTSILHGLGLPSGNCMDDSYWQLVQPKVLEHLHKRMALIKDFDPIRPANSERHTVALKDNLAGEIFAVENDRRDGTILAERMKLFRQWVNDQRIKRSYDGERANWNYQVGEAVIPIEDGGLLNDTLWAKLFLAIETLTAPPDRGVYEQANTYNQCQ